MADVLLTLHVILPLKLKLTDYAIYQLASGHQGSSCLLPPSTEIIDMHHQAQHLHHYRGFKRRSS